MSSAAFAHPVTCAAGPAAALAVAVAVTACDGPAGGRSGTAAAGPSPGADGPAVRVRGGDAIVPLAGPPRYVR